MTWTHTSRLGELLRLPERHRGNSAHEGIGRDALQVEEHAVHEQQQHDVLAVREAFPASADHRQVLWATTEMALQPGLLSRLRHREAWGHRHPVSRVHRLARSSALNTAFWGDSPHSERMHTWPMSPREGAQHHCIQEIRANSTTGDRLTPIRMATIENRKRKGQVQARTGGSWSPRALLVGK